jgi:hypothetical protein
VSLNPPDASNEEVEPVSILNGIRYLFRDAFRDFKDVWALAQKRQKNEITLEEFSAAMGRRFSADTRPSL